jgi:hypothetical protein
MSFVERRPFFQVGFFCSHGVEPRPETIAKLVTEFAEFNFLPTTVQAFQLGPQPAPTQALHLQLITQDRQWTIDFEPHRFLIQQNAVGGEVPGPPNAFGTRTVQILRHLYSLYPHAATRLSFVTKGLCRQMSEDELSYVHGSLFTLPEFFQGSNPIEWSTRQVIRRTESVNDKSELLNVVTDLSRVQGVFADRQNQTMFDRIQIGLDINTFQGNQSQRFTPDDIGPFLDVAVRTIRDVETGVEGLVYG